MRIIVLFVLFFSFISFSEAYTPSDKDKAIANTLPQAMEMMYKNDNEKFYNIFNKIKDVLPFLEGRNEYLISAVFEAMEDIIDKNTLLEVKQDTQEEEKEEKEVMSEKVKEFSKNLNEKYELEKSISGSENYSDILLLSKVRREIVDMLESGYKDDEIKEALEITLDDIALDEYYLALTLFVLGEYDGDFDKIEESRDILLKLRSKNTFVKHETEIDEYLDEVSELYYKYQLILKKKFTSNSNREIFFIGHGRYELELTKIYGYDSYIGITLLDEYGDYVDSVVSDANYDGQGIIGNYTFFINEGGNYMFEIDDSKKSYSFKIKRK